MRIRILIPSLILAALALDAFGAQQPVETTHENGQVHQRYSIDALGRKTGSFEEFRADGTLAMRLHFVAGTLDGRAEEFFADGRTLMSAGDYQAGLRRGTWLFVAEDAKRRQRAEFKAGLLHGTVTIESEGKLLSKQTWKEGELKKLDDLAPFPVPRKELREKLQAILAEPDPPVAASADALAPERAAALRRLRAYRALCGLPQDSMQLVADWNLRCDAAAEVCAANGGLDHTPPQPSGMDDARYRLGYEGASNSNLSVGSDLPDSVDGYMDDSDPSNIDRVGHRRWCLNPAMQRTGFGLSGRYAAMWSMDASGKGVRGMEAVLYPPPGWCPVDMLAPRAAFSISRLRGGEPKLEDLRIRVRALDSDWVLGEELELDHKGVSEGGFGTGPCIIFRPAGLVVDLDSRYWIEVSTDAGKTVAFRYVVAFCEAVKPARTR